ncbi:DUF72 domain-containing protein [Caminibacter mediatlanticus TB-2]|uniref:DUF72 domain-containing protein n=1 Tax=Caminibacter mediatlanticus TB-2 TaxID=391592 RepID=A0AAI9AGM1_9BACT|nr:DUF72 domain-containing protein [Caminibacter mediatlanticus]EDM23816.1 hypothetical cytosolic protein [Caminibacter mediatlanticus TB-2]QCT94717.1 DUF72 domain-containing protein [Caminibacter mediatlanticus TB-2]
MFFVGTSGFNYSKWKGKFYPDELLKSKWLEYYVKYFNSLELNSMFYKIPKEATIKSWKYKLKKLNLILSIKANKIITHTYKLKNFDKTNKFLELISPLEEYLGAILFQLPPSLKYDYSLLNEFLINIKFQYKYAIEFRHKTWYNDKIYNLLRNYNIALVWHDFNQPFVLEKTANFTYTRFHGYSGKYKGSYPDEFLQTIINHSNTGFCYFNNTDDVSAPYDALRFRKLIEK